MSRKDDIKKLIRTHNRRLQILEEQKAVQGVAVNPKIIIEIEDIEKELGKLEVELEEIEEEVAGSPQINSTTSSGAHGKSQRVIIRCFLSCSFSEEDRTIRNWFKDFIEAFPDFEVVLADAGIDTPSKQVEECLNRCQLACFVFTNRQGSISPWILPELEMARKRDLTLFAFVEKGLSPDKLGTLSSYLAYQQFDRKELCPSIPLFIRYIYNARVATLKKLGIDRMTLASTVSDLRINKETLVSTVSDLRRKVELLDLMLEPRMFDD